MAGATEPIDAVIISGARRGEIVRLPEGLPAITEREISALNQALDDLIAAVDRVSAEVRATTEAIKQQPETPNAR